MSQVQALGLKKECESKGVVLKGEKQQAGLLTGRDAFEGDSDVP